MKVFLSWSGPTSRQIAEALHDWLPTVIQQIQPYFTPNDIDKGKRWSSDIAHELGKSKFGILCLTRDNVNSNWIHFEAGALSKSLNDAYVCPILFGLKNADLSGPLSQFQTTEYTKNDIRKLVTNINSVLNEKQLPEKTLNTTFTTFWPYLNEKIETILSLESSKPEVEPLRSDRELLEEIIATLRTNNDLKKQETSPVIEEIQVSFKNEIYESSKIIQKIKNVVNRLSKNNNIISVVSENGSLSYLIFQIQQRNVADLKIILANHFKSQEYEVFHGNALNIEQI